MMKPYYTRTARTQILFATFIGFFALVAITGARAQTSWNAGNGNFTDGFNWNNGAPGASTAATISATSTLSINLPTSDTIGSLLTTGSGTIVLTLNTNALTITGSSSPALSITNGSSLTLTGTTTGGSVIIQSGQLAIGDNSGNNGTLNLGAGSTLAVGGINGIATGTGTSIINGMGGTIKVINSSLTTGIAVTLASNTYTSINTNGFDASFTGGVNNTSANNGGFVKAGLGNFTFGSTSNTIASFFVTGGNLNQTAGTLNASEIGVGSGSGSVATYTMTGGTIILKVGTPPPIVGGSASSMRIGDFGGTGTFTQSGGTVQVDGSLNIGNQGGHGTYVLSGGNLNLQSGFSTLARTAGGTGGSTGELDISGTGTVTVSGNASLILSNWYPSSATTKGVGVLNQTGGTMVVANTASLILTGMGTGTYNLNGGTLAIGGSSLQGNYPSQNGTYAFNLGGGTIKVSGSNLFTSVNATLTGSTTSTVDTNGLSASLSGILGGTGKLAKTGSGSLTLTGSNSYSGGTTVSSGTLLANNASGSATGSGTLTVASGATIGGTGRVAPSSFNISGNVLVGNGIDTTSSFTMTNTGSSTFTGATLQFNLGNTAGQNNVLHLGTGATDFSSTTVTLTFNSGLPPADSLFTLIDNGTGSSTYTGLTLGGLDINGYTIITGGLVLANQNGSYLYLNGGTIGVSESSVVPEPGTWMLLLCGMVALVFLHRRRCSFAR